MRRSNHDRVLVTGATGFIGRHAVPILLERGYNVYAVSRTQPPAWETVPKNLVFHFCDLLSDKGVNELLPRIQPTHLLHFAWDVVPGKFWTALDNLAWIAASLRLFQRFTEVGGQRAVFAGTCAEYDWSAEYLSEKTTPLVPRSLYGVTKNSLRLCVEKAAGQLGLSMAWGRIFFLYGPHEQAKRLIPSVITSLISRKPVACTHGRQRRDFMHVSDVARAFVDLMESTWEGPINIASGEAVMIKTVVDLIGEIVGHHDLIEFGGLETPSDEPACLSADVEILRKRIGFVPRYNLETGLQNTIEWWNGCLRSRPGKHPMG
ncbi:MAG: NAD-dependent epimerase/dehydratase family protein [Candidatus Binatia bacterium]